MGSSYDVLESVDLSSFVVPSNLAPSASARIWTTGSVDPIREHVPTTVQLQDNGSIPCEVSSDCVQLSHLHIPLT